MNSIFSRVMNAYLLVPLGRGGRGGYPSGNGVKNCGLWWPEEASEGIGPKLPLLLPPRWRLCLGCWYGEETTSGDEGGVGWLTGHY